MFLSDDVDYACDSIATIECRGSTLHYLYLLDVVGINKAQVVLSTHIAMHALAIYHDEDIAVAQSIHGDAATHVTPIEIQRSSQHAQDIL